MIHSEPIARSRTNPHFPIGMLSPAVVFLSRSGARLAMAATLMIAITACASTPQVPTQQLQAAELAITSAEQARVADYASPELNQARQKLTASRTAVQDQEMVLAARLADEARVSAELASAKTEMLKAKEINDEMERSILTLKQEMQRNSGTAQ